MVSTERWTLLALTICMIGAAVAAIGETSNAGQKPAAAAITPVPPGTATPPSGDETHVPNETAVPAKPSAGVTHTEADIAGGALLKAREIVRDYTPDKKVWVRGFRSGLRVVGLSIEKRSGLPGTTPAVKMRMTAPDWFEGASLLGEVSTGLGFDVRLLWKVEPTVGTHPEAEEFSVKLVNHDGYTQTPQQNERSRVKHADHPFGTVFWTEHSFEAFTNSPPGLYDLYVCGAVLPAETIPLGQVLMTGNAEPSETVAVQVKALFPKGRCVFAGNAVLSKWFSCTLDVESPQAAPRKLIVISSADWLEDHPDETPVANVTLNYPSGKQAEHVILLGRDTASTWYNLHARGVVKHKPAPVAWSSRVRRETVDFESNVYCGTFDLAPENQSPSSIEVSYAAERGILRLRGVVLEP